MLVTCLDLYNVCVLIKFINFDEKKAKSHKILQKVDILPELNYSNFGDQYMENKLYIEV